MIHLIFISFLSQILRDAKLNGFFQNAEEPQDHMFFLIFMSAILVNDNFMGTWFSKTPRRLLFQKFLDNVTGEIAQPDSLSLILSRMDAYLRKNGRIKYNEAHSYWTEEEISAWKLAILYFFEMFVFKSLAGPRFLNIQLTDDLLMEYRLQLGIYQKYDPELCMMEYFQKKAIKFGDRMKEMMKEHQFWERKNPLMRLLGVTRMVRNQILNFCDFCKKSNCTRCRLCNKHECGCCKQCETPDSCCRLCRLCTSCSQHDHAVCRDKLRDASGILVRFSKKVISLSTIRYLFLKRSGDYCYLCKRGEDRSSFTCYGKGVLPCGHHFCEKCTKRMISSDKRYKRTLCPLCITPIGEYRDIIWTINYVKLFHPLIFTTRDFYLARANISYRIMVRFRLPKRYKMLLNFDMHITRSDCAICLEKIEDPMILHCGHVFCHECINHLQPLDSSLQCPSCRIKFNKGFDLFDPSTCLIRFIFGTRYEPARRVYL